MKIQQQVLVMVIALMMMVPASTHTVSANDTHFESNGQHTDVDTANCDGAEQENMASDDGLYESGHNAATIVSLFTPPSYPFHFTHGCICWVSAVSGISLDFDVVLYEDTGSGPGSLLARFPYHVDELSRWLTTSSIYQVPINYVLSSGSVYIGATKLSDVEAFMCADQSMSTEQQAIFQSDERGLSPDWQTIDGPYRSMSIRAEGELPHSTFSATDNWINSSPGDLTLPVAIYPGSIEVFSIDPSTGEGMLTLRVNNEQIEAAGVPSISQGFVLLAKGLHPATRRDVAVYRLATGEFQLNTWNWDGSPYQVVWSGEEDEVSSPDGAVIQ